MQGRSYVGVYRDHDTLEAIEYFFKSPDLLEDRLTIVVDPMLATGNSSIAAVDKLKGDNHDQDVGIAIARRAMEDPLRQIVTNAGEEASVVLSNVASKKGNTGYNAATGEYGDMIKMGILDPTKVTRTALQKKLPSKLILVCKLPRDQPRQGWDHHDSKHNRQWAKHC